MRTVRKVVQLGIDEFVAWEDEQPEKNELVSGEPFPVAGEIILHSRTVVTVGTTLHAKLAKPHEVFMLQVKVTAEAVGSVYYPDVVISCAEQDDLSTVLKEPSLVVEILSPSTAAFDRRKKRPDYATIPSMRVIILVDPEERLVELDRRDPDGGWSRETFTGEGTLDLPEVGASLTLDEIFAE